MADNAPQNPPSTHRGVSHRTYAVRCILVSALVTLLIVVVSYALFSSRATHRDTSSGSPTSSTLDGMNYRIYSLQWLVNGLAEQNGGNPIPDPIAPSVAPDLPSYDDLCDTNSFAMPISLKGHDPANEMIQAKTSTDGTKITWVNTPQPITGIWNGLGASPYTSGLFAHRSDFKAHSTARWTGADTIVFCVDDGSSNSSNTSVPNGGDIGNNTLGDLTN